MKKIAISLFAFLSFTSNSEVLYGVDIVKIYAQSTTGGSAAHLIKLGIDLPDKCNGDRVYLDFEGTAMYSLLLAKHISGQKVDVIYSLDAEPKNANGHLAGLTCKLESVF